MPLDPWAQAAIRLSSKKQKKAAIRHRQNVEGKAWPRGKHVKNLRNEKIYREEELFRLHSGVTRDEPYLFGRMQVLRTLQEHYSRAGGSFFV
jgi:hypothetical protein